MTAVTHLSRRIALLSLLACAAAVASHTPAPDPTQTPTEIVHAGPLARTGVDRDATTVGAGERAAASTGRGYTFLQSTLIAETPTGFQVWVDPHAPHHWSIAASASAAVSDLHKLGTTIRWRGYGQPAAAEGVVRIREGRKGCGSTSTTIGMTYTSWATLPSGKRYATHADVYLCPRLFRMGTWATKATVRHELGHAMGLGHTSYRYQGSYQVMNPAVRSSVITYRTGDQAGLRKLAATTRTIKTQIPPIGHLDASTYTDGNIQFTGWALLQYYPSTSADITLTDNGTIIYRGDTPLDRPDINHNHHASGTHGYQFTTPWTGGNHHYCLTAQSPQHPIATATLGCVTWNG